MLRRSFRSSAADAPLTPPQWNVYEASFHSISHYAVAAVIQPDASPEILLIDHGRRNISAAIVDARYPALSPDGQWLAYSHLDRGVWNLWIRAENGSAARRIADVPCNQIQPSWESDSKTLLYSTDCGRSVWFTAVARRKVLP
jgi:Tol biopolymer transport system component